MQGGDILSGASRFTWRAVLSLIIPDGLRLVRNTSDYSPWVPVDEFLDKPLGLTNSYDTPHSYIQL